MALSGTFYSNFAGYYRLQLEWQATQNVSNNTSYIETQLYLVSLNSASTISSSSSKTAKLTIAGSTVEKTAGGLATVSGGQKKLLHSTQKTVNHNSDGSLSAALSGSMEFGFTINGSYVGTVSVSGTAVLNKIARNSALASSPNLTAGMPWSISIDRASTAFTHEVRLYVDEVGIVTVRDVAASRTYYFTQAESTQIFQLLQGKASAATRIVVITYDGNGDQVGSWSTHNGTVTKEAVSTLDNYPTSVSVGSDIPFTVVRNLSTYHHTVKLVKDGVTYKTLTNVSTSGTMSTADIQTALNNAIGSASYGNFALVTETFYNDVPIGGSTNAYLAINAQTDPPIFAGNVLYEDVDTKTKTITGNNKVIVSRQSDLKVTIPSNGKAIGQNGATIERYDVTFGGYTRSVSEAAGDRSVTFVNPVITGNTALSVTAVDNRGNKTTVTATVTGVVYNVPTLSATVKRAGGFGDTITITSRGGFSPVLVNGFNKNDILTLRYRYKPKTSISWGTWTTIGFTQGSTSYTGANANLSLTNTSSYDFEIEVTDRFGSTLTKTSIAPGSPLLFIDKAMQSVGVNRFPTVSNRFEVGGSIYATGVIESATDVKATEFSGQRANLLSTSGVTGSSTNNALNIGNPTSGSSLKFDSDEINSYTNGVGSTLYLNWHGGDVYLNASNYRFTPTSLIRSSYKEPNGHNIATIRDGTVGHSSLMTIQNQKVSITVTGQSFVDISFPEAFDVAPLWVIATGEESSSSAYNCTAYNITRFGARIYAAHIHNVSTAFTITVSVVACGRKA